jgi:hypothetical protein
MRAAASSLDPGSSFDIKPVNLRVVVRTTVTSREAPADISAWVSG